MDRIEKRQAWRRGHAGEILASVLLFAKGYRILERRFKTPVGEIDLIARRGLWIVFVEVKVRRSLDEAIESISKKNRARVIRAAKWYLSGPARFQVLGSGKTGHAPQPFVRFDAIVLAPPFFIRHIQNAWPEDF